MAAAVVLSVGLGGLGGWQMRGWQTSALVAAASGPGAAGTQIHAGIDAGNGTAVDAGAGAGPGTRTEAEKTGAATLAAGTIPLRPMGDALAAYRLVVDHQARVDLVSKQPAELQAWLDRSVGSHARLPDLSAAGFAPVGGRLFATEGGAAAMVFYEDAAGHTVSFYVRPAATPQRRLSNGSRQDGTLLTRYGSRPGYNYAVVAPQQGVDDAALARALGSVRG